MLYILCTVGLKMQLIGYLDDYAWGCCKWLAMAPLTRQACGRALARLARAEAGRPVGRLLHTGIFDQNPFHSTTYSAPGMARILKEAKLHGKFECVWLMCWYSTRFEQIWKAVKHSIFICEFLQFFPLCSNLVKYQHMNHTYSNFSCNFAYLETPTILRDE